jgi:hypothetical protein
MTDQELMDRIFELPEGAGVAPMKTISAVSSNADSTSSAESSSRLVYNGRRGTAI